jgi:hypothetical protein
MTTRDTPHPIAPPGLIPMPDGNNTQLPLGNSLAQAGLFADLAEQRAPEA